MSTALAPSAPCRQILVIHQNIEARQPLLQDLRGQFTLLDSSDLTEAIAYIHQQKPLLTILDMDLILENQDEHLFTQIKTPLTLYISAYDSLDQRLKAYELGGDDFLGGDITSKALQTEVKRLFAMYEREQTLIKGKSDATQMALSAMTEASMYGDALRFINNLHSAETITAVRDLFFTYMKSLDLNTSLCLRCTTTNYYNSAKNPCSPIEIDIFKALGNKDRTIALSNRYIVNGTVVSFIVKDMPIDNELQMGRLRDILVTAVDGIDAKVLEIQRVNLIRETTQELADASKRLSYVVSAHKQYVASAMEKSITEINASFHRLDMSDEQELFFTALCTKLVEGLDQSTEQISHEQQVLQCLWLSMDNLVNFQVDE